ncbi:MAG TPA: hypothetical protein PKY31_15905 [Spirochaetota bacterium]|nr:hypothetical protein [Spirochaetota bacterium]
MIESYLRYKRPQARKNERVMFPMNIRKLGYGITILAMLAVAGGVARATTIEMEIIPSDLLISVGVDFSDYAATSQELTQHPNLFIHKNSEVLPTGLAMANVLGYPNGRAMIGQFPHFEFGVSAGVAAYQIFRYQDYNKDNPEIPGGGVNGAFHFGTGIDDRMDIMFKIFVLGSYFTYDRTFDQKADDREYDMQVTDNSVYSFGVKTRFNVLRPSRRSFFSFGGVNLNLSFDYMSARFAAKGTYYTTQTVDVQVPDFINGTSEATPCEVYGTVNGSSTISWHLFSVTPEALAYFDVFYFISVYSGFAVSFNRGAVTFEADAEGELRNRTPIIDPNDNTLVDADQVIATAMLHADSSMTPNIVLPRFILGFEFDLWAFKLQLEASSLLTNPTDSFSAQVGIRTEF